jgi:lipopolysaccharide export system protein LptA
MKVCAGFCLLLLVAGPAWAQSTPPAAPAPIQITASQGIEWKQADQEVIATGSAQAVRGDVTVQADQLVAHYRKKAGAVAVTPAATPAPSDPEAALNGGDSEIYELEAVGHVHIFTPTDNAYGDHAVYNLDQAVLVLTGSALKLTTLHDVITARDAIEYYSVKRMAVARGDALITADDGRSIAADTLVGYLAPPDQAAAPAPAAPAAPPDMLGAAGRLQKVEAIGHVTIHTPNQTATGNSGTYLPDDGTARLGGNVHISSGPNQLSGSDALLNTKTGIATLVAAPGGQVAGTITPNTAAEAK